MNTCAVGLAGVQPVAGAADASVSIREVHTGPGATDVGGSSGTSVNICRRQSKAEVMGSQGRGQGSGAEWEESGVRVPWPERTHRNLISALVGPSHIHKACASCPPHLLPGPEPHQDGALSASLRPRSSRCQWPMSPQGLPLMSPA